MEITKDVSKWGNSAGVLLPREWLGNQVKIILIERTLEIKREVLNILEPYLEDILGIYITGSYARGEQHKDSDIDILTISKSIHKTIKSGKYDITITTLDSVKKAIIKNPILILPRLKEAKTILNPLLLDELKNIKIIKKSFKEFIEGCKRIEKINRGFINLDKEMGFKHLDSIDVIYSLILRLRGIYLMNALLENEKYSKREFLKYLSAYLDKMELEKAYNVYRSIRDNKKAKDKISIETAEKLLKLLKQELEKLK